MMNARFLALVVSCSTFAIVAACSDDSTTTSTPSTDGGGTDAPVETGPVVVGSNEVKQTGKIVHASERELGIASTITIAGKKVNTAADGTYEIAVPKDTPYQMTVEAPDFYKLIEQQWSVKQDLANGDTVVLPVAIANILALGLDPPRDKTKGLLIVGIRPQPPCDSEEGTTLAIDPPGSAKISYLEGQSPKPGLTSAKKGASFSAMIYDIEPGVTVRVSANSPLCEQLPFPAVIDGRTFLGDTKTEAGEVLSYVRVFLGPLKSTDAGTD